MTKNPYIVIHEEVLDALATSKPLVALESSVFCQGLPEMLCDDAQTQIERSARKHGAIPATICVFQGKIHIGTSRDIRHDLLMMRKENKLWKIAERDVAHAVAGGHSGGTTVSATCFIAHHVGIKVFATGGIGGVHRGLDLDISADLKSLSTYPLIVVSAGIKSILDRAKTLELLEAASVPVLSYRSDFFPNFYCDKSTLLSPRRVENLEEVVRLFACRQTLAQKEALLVAQTLNPQLCVNTELFEKTLGEALNRAQDMHVSSQKVTPFLLNYLANIKELNTVQANIELLKNNSQLAAQLALLLSKIRF